MSDEVDDRLNDVQDSLVQFMRSMEEVQQSILFQDIGQAQRELKAATGSSLNAAAKILDQLKPEPHHAALFSNVRGALSDLTNAYELFIREGGWPEFSHAFLLSRGHHCKALGVLYAHRTSLKKIDQFFRLSDVDVRDPRFDSSTPTQNDVATGLIHHKASDVHHDYSLYVPEYYTSDHPWPVVVALHGGYGRGDEYIWSWLRAARSRGYVVLSPKSIGPTWSMMQPTLDGDSIMAMLDVVAEKYALDRARVLLTGLSDGGSFSYLLGLQHHEQFAALAPISTLR